MTIEKDILTTLTAGLGAFVGDRVFVDGAPAGTQTPYVVFTQVGGATFGFLESKAPDKKNGRFQVNAWADTRLAVAPIGRLIEDVLVESPALRATVLTGVSSANNDGVDLHGTQQDFSIWFAS
ncbi:hypothetical protein GCM10007242_16520 [Pigmentiphaga litoralis]|uniref:tail completion protein gp17 n=1 Tax=Pigmentiphaga litoralis TaxID=516702 RepID=UPI0016763CDC|nr:DUF3168 domain-containing protein [Pigmentiphaga litoralis]GGX11155.1 hypothetical protein GCM10007242_16520 [Pigmentiphaga litoralis]